jgi:hypothetical protein
LIWIAALLVLFGTRLVWQTKPNVATCALFWATSLLVVVALEWSAALSQFAVSAGILCNASVTLANGGFMPVAMRRRGAGSRARSLWVQRQSGQRLLFLADNFGNDRIRFSVGDVLLFIGIIASAFGL